MGVQGGYHKATQKRTLADHRPTSAIKPIVKTVSTKTGANQWARLIESEIARGVVLDRSEVERTKLAERIDRFCRTPHLQRNPLNAGRGTHRLKSLKRHIGKFSTAILGSEHIAVNPSTSAFAYSWLVTSSRSITIGEFLCSPHTILCEPISVSHR